MNDHQGHNKSEALAKRLAAFGGRVVELAEAMPDTKSGRHVRDQLLRSATAPGAHCAEARSAPSNDDFIHKVGLAAKEAREAIHWLRVACRAEMVEREIRPLNGEADELVAMLFSSLQSARGG